MLQRMKWHDRLNAALREKRWSVPDLAREMGQPDDQALINRLYKYTAGEVENPRGSALADIGKAIGLTEIELRAPDALTTRRDNTGENSAPAPNARLGSGVSGFARIPIRGQGMGGKDGALIFNGDVNMGDVLAPPALANVSGAYAAYVVGDSMKERYRDGEIAYVHPFLPVKKGDGCVVQMDNEAGERVGFVKQFVSRDDKWVKVLQFNPKRVLRFPRSRVHSIHKIVMSGPA